MRLFDIFKAKIDFSKGVIPVVTELQLRKKYRFMYENFVINTQRELYLMLEENNGIVEAIKFNFLIYKYGIPNDEGLGAHPMAKFGLGFYGFYHVANSTWIAELKEQRPKTNYDLFSGFDHYIVTLKDVTIDIISKEFQEVELTKEEIHELTNLQLSYLTTD